MKYCPNCGKQVDPNAYVCLNCGVKLQSESGANDTGGVGYGILGFFFPVVGLIIYLVNKDSKPNIAKSAGKGALISVIITAAIYHIAILFILIGAGTYGALS